MIRARRALLALAAAGLTVAALAASSRPASAELRTLTVTLIGGTQVTVTVDVPPGTPASAITVPGIPASQIVSVTEGPPPPTGPSSPGVSVGSTPTPPPASTPAATPPPAGSAPTSQGTSGSGSGTSSGGSQGGQTASPTVGGQRGQRTTGRKVLPAALSTRGNSKSKAQPKVPPPLAGQVLPNGLPTAANPTLSLALPGPATPGVPDFFIDKFRIPPFLLPIYEAAGTQYDVPWQILAAINEIESDYGRDLSTSTAGAVGWMQFLPSTWGQWGVDATGTGIKDPFNPADAIFAAARYLSAAGASKNLRAAIFAYNHANWYVDSVILRAKLIGGVPPQLLGAITGLTYGHFPVHARASYADDLTAQAAAARYARTHNAALPVDPVAHRTGINIFAKAGAPVIAVQDGRIVGEGRSQKLGNYLRLQDAYGNTYTYSGLKTIVSRYPVPKPTTESAAQVAHDLAAKPKAADAPPTAPATAGYQPLPSPAKAAKAVLNSGAAPPSAPPPEPAATPAPDLNQVASSVVSGVRLFTNSSTLGTGTAKATSSGGLPAGKGFNAYFTDVYGLNRNDVVLRPLKVGSKVIAGTILGRIGTTSSAMAPHVLFQVRPAGTGAPLIDPKPILDGWVLLERSSIYRAKGKNPFINGAPSVGQVLLESKEQLQAQVLRDPNITIYACGRRDVEAGQIDQRVLASMEFLSVSGLKPTVSALRCGHTGTPKPGAVSLASGNAMSLSAINGIPVVGHQTAGSITDITVRRLLTLQGTMKPNEIVSLMSFPGTDNTIAMKDHFDHVDVGYLPLYNSDPRFRKQVDSTLAPSQWIKLIGRLGQITEPQVSSTPSSAAIPDQPAKAAAPTPRHK
jgi:murein DD-endopeptidase MepM/ murein hydrolase activator NlpD